MTYKKYIQKNGKLYGPYEYKSKRVDGKVVSEYRGKKQGDKWSIVIISLIIIFVVVLMFLIIKNDSEKRKITILKENVCGPQEVDEINNFEIPNQKYLYEFSKATLTKEAIDKLVSDGYCECLDLPCARGYKPYTNETSGEKFCYQPNIITCLQSQFSDICVPKNKVGECSKYKCFDKYIVEVQK